MLSIRKLGWVCVRGRLAHYSQRLESQMSCKMWETAHKWTHNWIYTYSIYMRNEMHVQNVHTQIGRTMIWKLLDFLCSLNILLTNFGCNLDDAIANSYKTIELFCNAYLHMLHRKFRCTDFQCLCPEVHSFVHWFFPSSTRITQAKPQNTHTHT